MCRGHGTTLYLFRPACLCPPRREENDPERRTSTRKDRNLMTTPKRNLLACWTLLVLAFLLPARLRADETGPSKPGQPHVVLIGISDYADKQIKPRPRA